MLQAKNPVLRTMVNMRVGVYVCLMSGESIVFGLSVCHDSLRFKVADSQTTVDKETAENKQKRDYLHASKCLKDKGVDFVQTTSQFLRLIRKVFLSSTLAVPCNAALQNFPLNTN